MKQTQFYSFIALLLFFLPNLNAQNWQNPGNTPDYGIAYDQNGQNRIVVTSHNVYRSTNGGSSWTQKLSAANAPFLNSSFFNSPTWAEGNFQGFVYDQCRVFDDVLFLTADVGTSYSSKDWKLYSSSDGGTTLTESFAEDDAYQNATYGYDHEIYKVDANTYIIRFQSNGVQPSGDPASIYVTTNKGQSWNLLFRNAVNNIHYAGTSGNNFVFLQDDQLIYRNKVNGSLANTVSLPGTCHAASVVGNTIELIGWNGNDNTLRGYRSTNGGSNFTNYTTSISGGNFRGAQILGNFAFINAGSFSSNSNSYRISFSNFNNPVLVSPGNNQNYYPFRITSDGNMANLIVGTQPHFGNIFYNGGDTFNTPFVVSTNNWNSFSPAEKPPYSLESLPLMSGKRLLFKGGYAWNTTDGITFNQGFQLASGASSIQYYQGAAFASAYSDPSTYAYITNDATTVASNEDYVVGTGNTLYSWRRDGGTSLGIYKSTDKGSTWSYHNDGYFWNFDVIGDDVKGTMYGIERVGNPSGDNIDIRLSKSDDQGLNWKLLDGANIPSVSGEDYYYNDFLPIVVYNNYFFVKSNNILHYSTNGGVSFQTANNLPFTVGGSQMYLLDGDLCFKSGAEQFYRVNINQWLGSGGGATLPGANVDLSMSVNMTPANPGPWSNFEVTYSITNSGTIPATRVSWQNFIASSNDAIPQGGSTIQISGMSSTLPFGYTLNPGQTGTITYSYFRKDGAVPQPYGQVRNHAEPDIDSRPNNADWPNVQEDDEAIFGGSPVCAITLNSYPGSCEDNGTPSNAGDDKYDLTIVAINPVSGSGYQVYIPQLNQTYNGTYGTSLVIDNIPISAGTLSLQATDNNTSTCSNTGSVAPPATCSSSNNPCSPDVTPPSISGCPSDITKFTGGTSVTVNWSSPSANDNCAGTPTLTSTHSSGSSFPIGTTTVTYTATDAAGNTSDCSFDVTVSPQGGGEIDLAIALVQSNPSPSQWTTYSVTATLTNAGPQTATGVQVAFKKPDGVVYTGGSEFVASQGSFNPSGNEVWTVGNIPANGSATLTVNYFLRVATGPVAYAQVQSANQNDADSTPNNGTPPTVNEDDEASTSTGGGPNLCEMIERTVSNKVCNNNGTNSNANDDTWTFRLNVTLAGNNCAGTNWTIPGVASSSYGTPVTIGPYPIADGNKTFTATQVGNSSISKTFTVGPPATCSTGGGQLPDMKITGLNIPNTSVAAGAVLSYNFDLKNIGTADIPGAFSVKGYISTNNTLSSNDIQDGTIGTGNFSVGQEANNVPAASTIPASLAPGNYYLIVKVDGDDDIAESNESNNTVVKAFTVTGGGNTGCAAVNITPSQGQITISGASAPHVLIKVFRPNWSVAFECLDGACSNPEVVSGLNSGNHFVSVKLLDASWGEICTKELTVNVSSNGPSNRTIKERQRMAFDNIYPNPAQHWVVMKIYSKDNQAAQLDFYNSQGQSVHRIQTRLEAGVNEIEVDVSSWNSGTYNVISRGNGPPAYGRFLKVWED